MRGAGGDKLSTQTFEAREHLEDGREGGRAIGRSPGHSIPKLGAGDEGKGYSGHDVSARREYAGAEPGQSGSADTHLSCLESNQAGGKPAPDSEITPRDGRSKAMVVADRSNRAPCKSELRVAPTAPRDGGAHSIESPVHIVPRAPGLGDFPKKLCRHGHDLLVTGIRFQRSRGCTQRICARCAVEAVQRCKAKRRAA